MLKSNRLKQIVVFLPVPSSYRFMKQEYLGKRLPLHRLLGAAGSACPAEELIAMGFSKFIVCGAAGVLQKGIQKMVIPGSAFSCPGSGRRVSYHYIEPSREIECNPTL